MKLLYSMVTASTLVAAQTSSLSQNITEALSSVVQIKIQRSTPANEDKEWIEIDAGGSGFALDEQGHILTNEHVIRNAKKISVIDNKNTEYTAQLVAKDVKSDIAILKVAAGTLIVPRFADPDALELGMKVYAAGAPYSLSRSVSGGIIGHMKRYLPNYPYLHYLQTDTAINPGNSGGPLFNEKGEIIGMVSTYFSKQGNYTNLGFTLPIDEVSRIAQRLLEEKKISRGYLGAELLLSDKLTRAMGQRTGVLVTRVDPDSPAAKGGLRSGDLIYELNTTPFSDPGELHRLLESSVPGNCFGITYARDREALNTSVCLANPPVEKNETSNAGSTDAAEKLGLILTETDHALRVITTFSEAKTVGIDPNDVIIKIDGSYVKTIKELNTHLSKLKEGELAFIGILRNGNVITLPIGTKNALKGYSTKN